MQCRVASRDSCVPLPIFPSELIQSADVLSKSGSSFVVVFVFVCCVELKTGVSVYRDRVCVSGRCVCMFVCVLKVYITIGMQVIIMWYVVRGYHKFLEYQYSALVGAS